MHCDHFWPFSKCSHVSNISCFLEPVFAQKNSKMFVERFFSGFWQFFFYRNWVFCMSYSLCILVSFGHIQNAPIIRILGVLWSLFFAKKNSNVFVERFFVCLRQFYFFDPNWVFCMGYSLCIAAIFGHFQNALIFRILAGFWSRFLHRTTAMCCRNVFSMFLCIFNFWPKVTILLSL